MSNSQQVKASTQAPLRIAIVAGELSGDQLAADLMRSLQQRISRVSFFGIGGPNMQRHGFDSWVAIEKLKVNGYSDVLWRLRELHGIRNGLLHRLLSDPPDLFIGVDAPDFNLWLEARLKRKAIPVVHYVSPSIWAWRGGRIKKIKKSVTHMLALFPMEAPLYEAAGVSVTYVGHPFADEIPLDNDRVSAAEAMELPSDAPVFALLPGSRQAEVSNMADTFVQVAQNVYQTLPTARFLVPLATRETHTIFRDAMLNNNVGQDFPLRVMIGHPRQAIAAADCVLTACGTAALEVMLIKRPQVITYKLSPSNYHIIRMRSYLPYFSLPNILAGRFLAPEIFQGDATPENLSQALLNLYNDKKMAAYQCAEYRRLHLKLRQGASDNAAEAALSVLAHANS